MTVAWRLLIGPYHRDYPWYTHDVGDTEDLAAIGTTLTTAMSAGSTSTIHVGSASDFAASGGVWIGPINSGEGWEYVRYGGKTSNTITTPVREPEATRDHSGTHGSGAVVRPWYPITNDNGELSITETMDETVSVITWQASISGFKFPQHAIRNNHIAIVQTKATGGSWANYLVGFVDSPSASGDHTNNSPWSITIRAVDVLLQGKVKPLRIGGLDLAKEGTATSSTPLVLAFDERASGDYTAAAPSFDASQAIDRNPKTLWIAERFMGTEIEYHFSTEDDENEGPEVFDQVYLNPPPGTPAGARWIQLLRAVSKGNFQDQALEVADSDIPDGHTFEQLLHNGEVTEEGFIILCENERIFRQLNPLASPDLLLEYPDIFRHVLVPGGQLWTRNGVISAWQANMIWGDGDGYINHEDAPEGHHYSPTITPPNTGETMRYLYQESAAHHADYWETGMVRSAGYKISHDNNQWIAIELPGLGLMFTESITATVPGIGDLLRISDSAGPSNSGLPASGRIQVGDEQIDYSAKADGGVIVSGRHVNFTVAAIHDKDDLIYIVEDGLLSDAHLLNSVGWRRYDGTIVPSRFKLYRSVLKEPRSPEEDGWGDDWIIVGSQVTGNTDSTWDYEMSPSLRCRHIMFTIDIMSVDPARVRLNEIVANVDKSAYDTSLWLDNGVCAGAVIARLVQLAGLNPDIVSDGGDTNQLYDQTTADDVAWSVITDLAEFAGCKLSVGRDSKIYVNDDTFWETSSLVVGPAPWDATNTIDIQASLRNGISTSQQKLVWRTPDSSSKGTEVYPANDSGFGQAIETQELIYLNAGAAQVAAKKRYILGRYPYEFTINVTTDISGTRPSEIYSVIWQYNKDALAVARKCLLRSLQHKLKNGRWSANLQLVQIEREAEY